MYTVAFIKCFTFIIYMSVILANKLLLTSNENNNNNNKPWTIGDDMTGVATTWINPYITRYRLTSTTTTTTTTTTTAKRTARPRKPRSLKQILAISDYKVNSSNRF